MNDGPQILVSRENAARLLQLGKRTFDRLRAAGQVGPREIKLGGSVRYNMQELIAWAASGANGALPDRAEWGRMRNAAERTT